MLDRHDLGRPVYALSAICLGLIGLWWRDFAGVWQPLDNLGIEFNRPVVAAVYALAFLAAGAAALWPTAARVALPTLAFLHGLAMLGWMPRVITHGAWTGFFEMFSLTIAAVVGYARLQPLTSVPAAKTIEMGRVMFSICLVVFGLSHFVYGEETARMVPPWLPPGPMFWAYATGALYVLAGIAIAARMQAVLAARLTVAMMLVINGLVWLPMLIDKPEHFNWCGNAITFAMAAAAWVLADAIAMPAYRRIVA